MNNSPRKLLVVVGVLAAMSTLTGNTLARVAGPPIAREPSQFPSGRVGGVASKVALSHAAAGHRSRLNSHP